MSVRAIAANAGLSSTRVHERVATVQHGNMLFSGLGRTFFAAALGGEAIEDDPAGELAIRQEGVLGLCFDVGVP